MPAPKNKPKQLYKVLSRQGLSLAEEWLEVGKLFQIEGRFEEAENAYSNGLRVDPNNGPILCNAGILYAQQDKILLAIQFMERALLFDDSNPVIWYNYALVLMEAERNEEAVSAIQHSINIEPDPHALSAAGGILISCGMADEAIEYFDHSLKLRHNEQTSDNAIYARTLANTDAIENFEARQVWYDNNRWKGEKKPHDNDRTMNRVLRIGYVGGDFKEHSASFIFSQIVTGHNVNIIESYCYMTQPSDSDVDAYTKKYKLKIRWRDIFSKTDEEAEAMIRADKIDILIDLSGHSGGNRLPLFTRKPAPIQVHAWGFAHGTGCPEIDYFFADEYAIPIEERKFFAEKIWDLPSIVGYGPPDYGHPGISPAPVARDGIITFGVFGRYEKISKQSLDAWHQILQAVPNSRIVFKDKAMRRPGVVRRIRGVLNTIDHKRILFMSQSSHPSQMLAYQGVDLVLDTFPHTGGVTSLEVLYMGVPIVTLYGSQVGGRTTVVVLRAMSRMGWIADSVDAYVEKAIELAKNKTEIAEARSVLRAELLKSPLCGANYITAVEGAYKEMWRRYILGANGDYEQQSKRDL